MNKTFAVLTPLPGQQATTARELLV
jgi:hypothetical protein